MWFKKTRKIQPTHHRGNPLFPKQKRRLVSSRTMIGATSLVLLLAAWVGVFFFHPFFFIHDIRISSPPLVPERALRQTIDTYLDGHFFFLFPRRSFWTLRPASLTQHLSEQYPFALFRVQKTYPSRLIVTDEGAQLTDFVTGSGNEYYINESGIVVYTLPTPIPLQFQMQDGEEEQNTQQYTRTISQISGERNPEVLLVFDGNVSTLHHGESVVTPSHIQQIRYIHRYFLDDIHAPLQYVDLSFRPDHIRLVTREGWYALLEEKENIDAQLQRLRLVLEESISDRSTLEYIDLRFGDRVYYTFK